MHSGIRVLFQSAQIQESNQQSAAWLAPKTVGRERRSQESLTSRGLGFWFGNKAKYLAEVKSEQEGKHSEFWK